MARLRILVILLVILNLLAFAGLQGWLGQPTVRGEPERLTNQLNPERIKLRTPPSPQADVSRTAAPTPTPAATVPSPAPEACVAVVIANADAARSLGEALAAQTELKVRDVAVEVPNSWWVHLPPADSREAAEARAAELRKQGVSDLFIVHEPGPHRFAVSLGLFRQEAQAERLVEQFRGKGVEARITPRGTVTHRIEIRGPAERLAALPAEIRARQPSATRGECQP